MEERPISDLSFEAYLMDEKLMGSRCTRCDAVYVPPRPICPACRGSEMRWENFSGRGKLAAFTCIAIAPPFMIAEGYNRDNPYVSGVVALEEGGRVNGRIEGVDPKNPEAIKIGMPMRVKYLHRGDTQTFLAFEPA